MKTYYEEVREMLDSYCYYLPFTLVHELNTEMYKYFNKYHVLYKMYQNDIFKGITFQGLFLRYVWLVMDHDNTSDEIEECLRKAGLMNEGPFNQVIFA